MHGAGGVTGRLAVQLAVARGATVVATAGPASAVRVRDYGARLVVDYHDPAWPARVRDVSPGRQGVGAAVNAAPSSAVTALQAVADEGRLATITGEPSPAARRAPVSSRSSLPDQSAELTISSGVVLCCSAARRRALGSGNMRSCRGLFVSLLPEVLGGQCHAIASSTAEQAASQRLHISPQIRWCS